jgi:hypothetical protein
MEIPTWVDAKKRSKSAKATARLKFMLTYLAAKNTGRGSMRALAELVGLDHSTLSTYIRRGAFSEAAAQRIEAKLGAKQITADMLVDPLSIGAPPA